MEVTVSKRVCSKTSHTGEERSFIYKNPPCNRGVTDNLYSVRSEELISGLESMVSQVTKQIPRSQQACKMI